MAGARAVLKVLAELTDTIPVSGSLVWVHVLEEDSLQAAQVVLDQIAPPGLAQFYDPRQIAAREIAAVLGGQEKYAWDTYLVFPPAAEWTMAPPRPSDWVHQLDYADWAPAHRRKTGTALYVALKSMIQNA